MGNVKSAILRSITTHRSSTIHRNMQTIHNRTKEQQTQMQQFYCVS